MEEELLAFDTSSAHAKIEIAQHLSTPDLINLAQISSAHATLFSPLIKTRKFLHHVTRGEHDAVNAMLTSDTSFIFKRDIVTDCSGREFQDITGFEYALWALDKWMWDAMINCIPNNEEGKRVFIQMLTQYKKVSSDGVTYTLNGKTITEQHFDFENTIIKELELQAALVNEQEVNNWNAIHKQWREGVGGAQKLLPMHIVHEYCSTNPFRPVPTFTSRPKLSKQFYNWTTNKDEAWFDENSRLGNMFAIFKGEPWPPGVGRARGIRDSRSGGANDDLAAMQALSQARTRDLVNLKSELERRKACDIPPWLNLNACQ